jgi:hypothetical protein
MSGLMPAGLQLARVLRAHVPDCVAETAQSRVCGFAVSGHWLGRSIPRG